MAKPQPEVFEERIHGHYLSVVRLPHESRWMKWLDGHYKGSCELLEIAMRQLEDEAAGERLTNGEVK